MNTVLIERYQAGGSLLHRLDARVKLLSTLLLIVGILLTPDRAWLAYPLIWTLLGSLAVLGEVGAWRLSSLAGFALPFMLAAVTLLFTTPGHPLLSIAGLSVTDAGLARFLAIALKSWLCVQVALLFSITTAFTELLWALESLRLPQTLVAIIGFMYRYLFTLRDEAQTLLRARAARSGTADPTRSGGSLRWRAQIAGGMAGNLFLRSYERSERVYAAMRARGYTGQTLRRDVAPPSVRAILIGALPLLILVGIQVLVRLV
jgi:cobalt/nickel transport system permease protein